MARMARTARTKRRGGPSLPGAILRERYLAPRAITVTELAEGCGVCFKHASAVLNDRASITPVMAVRLATALNTTAEEWLSAQNAVDLYDARKHIAASGKRPRPIKKA